MQNSLLSPAPHLKFEDGFCVVASEADYYDFEAQKQDAVTFLSENYEELKKLMTGDEAFGILDFGIADLISEESDRFCQSESLQPELLRLAENSEIDIGISRYRIPKKENRSTQFRRRVQMQKRAHHFYSIVRWSTDSARSPITSATAAVSAESSIGFSRWSANPAC